MIKEAFCSYETSKLLKEKGFDEGVYKYYKNRELRWSNAPWLETKFNSLFTRTKRVSAPTHQMALAWLREQGIHITIDPFIEDGAFKWYEPLVITPENPDWVNVLVKLKADFVYTSTYEDAVEAALKYSLENLI